MENRRIGKTFGQMYDEGYRLGDMQYTKGYVSRKTSDIFTCPVYEARGSRKGELYILEPAYNTSRYCFRHYLYKKEG